MAPSADGSRVPGFESRFAAFVAERHPLAVSVAMQALEVARKGGAKDDATAIDALRPAFRRELAKRLYHVLTAPDGIDETTPGTAAIKRLEQARAEIVE